MDSMDGVGGSGLTQSGSSMQCRSAHAADGAGGGRSVPTAICSFVHAVGKVQYTVAGAATFRRSVLHHGQVRAESEFGFNWCR